ncbi:unnamed protein product [Cylindrotheca closterium]|uniref:Ran GTPase-activating protein (RanGAP) involved in mRNA processing and transport n=1 Tax=Cylindrotheca closterium TaxID=2856 RepID=A0AAD2PV14_9STRA|nr:unnamed protein product [Cylindrotheca closterium]
MSTLRLYYGRDNDEMIRVLKQAQQRTVAVTRLEVRETVLDEEVVEAIIELILTSPIEVVQLDDCGAYLNMQTIRLAQTLGGIRSLRLSEPTFLSRFFLDKLLISATNLTHLRIQGHLEREQMLSLAEGLKGNTSLHTLDLSRSRVEDFSSLSDGVRGNSSLHSLKLRSIGLRDENVTELLESLKGHSQLESIDLSFNHMLHMDHVADFVEKQSHVTELLLGYQNVWQAPKVSVTRLVDTLRTNISIKTLSLARNKLENEDAVQLADALLDNDSIESINLRENRFTDVGVVALAKSLEKANSIREVSLLKNAIGNEGYKAILRAAQRNYDIFEMELNDDGAIAQQIQHETALNTGGRKLLFLDPPLALWSIVLARVNKIESLNEQHNISSGKCYSADVIFQMLKASNLFEGIVSRDPGELEKAYP